MRNNKRKAVFGRSPYYYENSRMIARSNRLVSGRKVTVREDARVYLHPLVFDEVMGKIGVIVNARPYMWDALVSFKLDSGKRQTYGFWQNVLKVVK